MVPQPVVGYACNPLCVLYDFDMPLPCSEFRFGYKDGDETHLQRCLPTLSRSQTPKRRNDCALKAASPLRQLLREGCEAWAWHGHGMGMAWHVVA